MFVDFMLRGKGKVREILLYLLPLLFFPKIVLAFTLSDAYWQFETLNIRIPSACSVTESCIVNEKGVPIVELDVSDYNEQTLHDAFGYETEEECVQRYLMYTFLNEKGEGKKIDNVHGYPLYIYECSVLLKEESRNELPVVIAFLIDKEADKVYAIFFENDLADLNSATEFLRYVTINHKLKNKGILYNNN